MAIVTPFVQVGTYPTRNFATLGPLRMPLKIQFSKPDKARAENCDAAYDLYARSNFL